MSRFTEDQKRIALLLLHEPKTAEELNSQLNIPYDKLLDELRGMLKLKVVEKQGFPTKYRLKDNIADEVRRRQQLGEGDSNLVRIRAFIEIQAVEEELLKRQLDKLSKAIKKEKAFNVYDIQRAKIEEADERYSSFLEVNFSVKDFSALIGFMLFYGPTAVEVLKPEKLELGAQDLQEGLVDIADMVNKYAAFIASKMNKQELDDFYNRLYK